MKRTQEERHSADDAAFFSLDCANLPDELYNSETPVEEWLKLCQTAPATGFAPGSLGEASGYDCQTAKTASAAPLLRHEA